MASLALSPWRQWRHHVHTLAGGPCLGNVNDGGADTDMHSCLDLSIDLEVQIFQTLGG